MVRRANKRTCKMYEGRVKNGSAFFVAMICDNCYKSAILTRNEKYRFPYLICYEHYDNT